jgi:flagellar biosynthesis protein FlhB
MAGAGDKTEAPTPRRLLEARRRGEIAFSRDLSGAAVFVAVFGILMLGASSGFAGLVLYMKSALSGAFSGQTAGVAVRAAVHAGAQIVLPLLLSAAVVALGVGMLQSKGLFSLQALRMDPTRVMPKVGRVLSPAALGEMAKGLLKVGAACAVVWLTIRPLCKDLGNLSGASPSRIVGALAHVLAHLGWRLAMLMLVLYTPLYAMEKGGKVRRSLPPAILQQVIISDIPLP